MRGVANSSKMLIHEDGISLSDWQIRLDEREKDKPGGMFTEQVKSIICQIQFLWTARPATRYQNIYPELLSSSVSVVTPNKKANSGSLKYYKKLHDLANKHNVAFKYETNAGAGLPIISTIDELVSTGDHVE